MIVSSVIVQNQVDLPFAVDRGIQPVEELQELLVAMAWLAVPDDRPTQHIESRESRRRALPNVVVSLPFRQPRTKGQNASSISASSSGEFCFGRPGRGTLTLPGLEYRRD
jgi:hypothetical protein